MMAEGRFAGGKGMSAGWGGAKDAALADFGLRLAAGGASRLDFALRMSAFSRVISNWTLGTESGGACATRRESISVGGGILAGAQFSGVRGEIAQFIPERRQDASLADGFEGAVGVAVFDGQTRGFRAKDRIGASDDPRRPVVLDDFQRAAWRDTFKLEFPLFPRER